MAASILTACSTGSGEGLDANGRPIGETPDPGDQPTLENIQARVFTPICVQCHVGASAPEGLRLDENNAYGDLVGVPSRQVSSLDRVEPSDSANSYLYQKIIGSASVGGRMPLGGPALPNEDVELIRQWIDDGAAPTVSTAEPGTVVSKQVIPDESKLVVRLAFSSQLDPTSMLATSVAVNPTYPRPSPNTYVRAIPGNAYAFEIVIENPGIGNFLVHINDGTSTALLDLSGQAIRPVRLELSRGELQ